MGLYRRWVERDVARWRKMGWIEPEGAEAIVADLADRHRPLRLDAVFALIGAALMCLALASFVAANWAELTRPTKLILGLMLLWGAYGAAYGFLRNGLRAAGEAALLIGVGAFGANIMLISQMYHLSGDPADAVLVWAIGGLAVGVLFRSAPALMFTTLLFVLWSNWGFPNEIPLRWGDAPALAALAAAFWRTGWRGSFHVLALCAAAWLLMLPWKLGPDAARYGLSFLAPLAAGAAAVAIGAAAERRAGLDQALDGRGRAVLVYGAVVAFVALVFWGQFAAHDVVAAAEDGTAPGDALPLLAQAAAAALNLGFLLVLIAWAVARDHRTLLWWAYAGLAAELTRLYLATLGSLLETAGFFLLAGAVVIAAATLSWRRTGRAAAVEERVE